MPESDSRDKIIDALMALAAKHPWNAVTLPAVAERAGVTLGALRAAYDGRLAILADFTRRTDETVLARIDMDMAGEAPRERLFDVLFSRLEELAPHKSAIGNLAEATRRDPLLALELNRIVTASMGWMLTAAGISAGGGRGALRAQGLAFVWARVLRVWLADDDPGLACTMAALDRQLRRAERMAIRLDRIGGFVQRHRRPDAKRRAGEDAGKDAGKDEDRDLAEGHPS